MNHTPTHKQALEPTRDPFTGIENDLSAEGLFHLAVWFQNSHSFEKAIECYALALKHDPNMVEAHYNVGVLRFQQKNWSEAIAQFRAAVKIKPDFMDAAFNLASSLKEFGRLEEAADMYGYVSELNPQSARTHYHQALCLQKMLQHSEAIATFKRALSLDKNNAQYWFDMAESFIQMESMDEVLVCYGNAAALNPNWDKAHYNLAIALRLNSRLSEAIAQMQKALRINPGYEDAIAYLFRLAQHACDWSLMGRTATQLDAVTAKQLAGGAKTSEFPLVNLRRHANPQHNTAIARNWSRHIALESSTMPERPTFKYAGNLHAKLRIGYLSADFKNHAVAHQIRGILTAHNREDFEIFAYIANRDDGTRYRQLLIDGCDKTRTIYDLSPVDAARCINSDGIDILVEMSGHSKESLLPIASMRPAPVQVSYLGFLSSTGADFVDYIIADEIVVPHTHSMHYSEQIVYMPHCYQANDDRQSISQHAYCRQDFDLPEDGFVYCSFNQPYKIDPELFKSWMTILKRVDGSVLWLSSFNDIAIQNLSNEALKSEIDPKRLVFTQVIPLENHLARLGLADLALDTWQYNGGATTSNALWAGVPVLTLLGNHWVSRMSASALYAIYMPELIASSKESYIEKAVDWAHSPVAIAGLKHKLHRNRTKAPFFNTPIFTKYLESAYRTMWKRYVNGQMPMTFRVEQ